MWRSSATIVLPAAGGKRRQSRRRRLGQRAAAFALALLMLPEPLAARQDDAFARALALAHEGRWTAVRNIADRISDPLLADYLRWRELLARGPRADFWELHRFLSRRPDWPGADRLRRLAEAALPEGLAPEEIAALFDSRAPLTGYGALRLAEALAELGRGREVRFWVRRFWPRARLDAVDEERFRRRLAEWITPDLDAERVRYLLWERRHREALRMLPGLPPKVRRLVRARLALQRAEPGVDARIRAVPERLRSDPGLLFDRLRWRLRKGRLDAAAALLFDPPAQPERPAAWWVQRRLAIFAALERGRYALAFDLAAGARPPPGRPLAEARWLEGWIALRLVQRPKRALQAFRALDRAVTSPVSRARAAYWAARASAALGREREARSWYRKAARYPTTFYGQEALAELGADLEKALLAQAQNPLSAELRAREEDSRIALARRLCRQGFAEEAFPFLEAAAREIADGEWAVRLWAELRSCGSAPAYVRITRSLSAQGLLPRLFAYPLVTLPEEDGVGRIAERALVLALLRQESSFSPTALSPKGARGLGQLMPDTARAAARRLGLPYSEGRLRRDPGYQLRLARAYFRDLRAAFGGERLLALAAYNAGPGRVRRWLARYGDPRRMDPHARLDWIERLPFAETRNYLQRVLEAELVYRFLLRHRLAVIPTFAVRAPAH